MKPAGERSGMEMAACGSIYGMVSPAASSMLFNPSTEILTLKIFVIS